MTTWINMGIGNRQLFIGLTNNSNNNETLTSPLNYDYYLFLENSVHVWILNRTLLELCAEWFAHWIRFQWLCWMVVVLFTLAVHKVNLLFKLSMGLKLFMGIAHTHYRISRAQDSIKSTIKLSNCLSLVVIHCSYCLWSRNTLNKTKTAFVYVLILLLLLNIH